MFDFSPVHGLAGLFVSAFVSATFLPGSSELLLVALLHVHPELLWPAVVVATIGNTLGGMTSYVLGRFLPNRAEVRAVAWLQKYGAWALLFSWVPVVGDALPLGAGWLRMPATPVVTMMATGKLLRYVVLATGWTWFSSTLL